MILGKPFNVKCLPLSGPYALVLLTGLKWQLTATKRYQNYLFGSGKQELDGGWGYSWVWHNCVHYLHYLLDHYKRNKYEIRKYPFWVNNTPTMGYSSWCLGNYKLSKFCLALSLFGIIWVL